MWSWRKKKPLVPVVKPAEQDEISQLARLATIHKLHPDKTYVFWFEQTMAPEYLMRTRLALEARGLKFVLMCGVKVPQIFEFKDGRMTMETVPEAPLSFGENVDQ